MKHWSSKRFWRAYAKLPPEVQAQADKQFALLKTNPRHPSLRLRHFGVVWSVSVNDGVRALGRNVEDGVVWWWIGNHDEYMRLLNEYA